MSEEQLQQCAEGWIADASSVEQAIATLTSPQLAGLLARCNYMPIALAYKALIEALLELRSAAAAP
jgi:hypothetical protein